MPSGNSCSVYGCSNSYRNTVNTKPKVMFYAFPKRKWEVELNRPNQWIQFVRRVGLNGKPWVPTKNSYICSQHFIGGRKSDDPRSPSFIPTVHPVKKMETHSNLKQQRYERLMARQMCPKKKTVADFADKDVNDGENMDVVPEVLEPFSKEAGCQTDDIGSNYSCLIEFCSFSNGNHVNTIVIHKKMPTPVTYKEKNLGQENRSCVFLGYESIKSNEKCLKDLTSVTTNTFSLLLHLLPNSDILPNEITRENKLLIFLIKMKQSLTFASLGSLFGIHPSTASRTFEHILSLLCQATKDWIIWPSKKTIADTMPKVFLESYPNCRVVIDCTEIKTERPKEIEKQVHLYSQYKGTYTVKFLLGITPLGLISFISKAYGGRTSDTFITNECNILKLLQPNDT